MRYQNKSSIAYMFRNFLKLAYVTLPTALLMAFAAYLYKPTCEIDLFVKLIGGKITADNYLTELLNGLSLLRYGKFWWVFVISVVVLAFAECLAVVKIDRHMRVGQMPVLPMKRAFGIYPLMLVYVLCFIAAFELGTLVAIGISFLIRFLANGTAIASVVLGLTLAVRIFISYVFGLLAVSFPLKYSENYRFNRAMSYSARVMFRKKRVVWGVALLYPLCRLITLGLAYLLQPYILDTLVYAVAFMLAVSYVPCFVYKQYYDEVGGERRDVGQIMFG